MHVESQNVSHIRIKIVNDTPNDEETMEPKKKKQKTTTTQESVRFNSFRAKIYSKYDKKKSKTTTMLQQQH